jgi:hypothetical protein
MRNEKDIKRIFSDRGALCRQVRLAAVQVEGLGDEELAMALAYELEPYSSIPAADAEVAWRELDGEDRSMRVFEAAVIRRTRSRRGLGGDMGRILRFAYAAGAIALLAAGADYAITRFESGRLGSSLERRLRLQQELDAIERKTAKLRRRASEIESERAAKESAQKECARLRLACLSLLDAVAAQQGKSVVKSISAAGPFAAELSLAAPGEREAASAMAELTGRLAEGGWAFMPGPVAFSGKATTVEFKGKAVLRQ